MSENTELNLAGAIQAFLNAEFLTRQEAANHYNVPVELFVPILGEENNEQ
jgi:hypothetical protein